MKEKINEISFGSRAILLLGTGFGLGQIPKAPGTFGTLLGVPLALMLPHLNPALAVTMILLLVSGAVWIAHQSERILQKKDPGAVVIDEIAGMVVTLAGIPHGWGTITAGFFLFRFLDIIKPFPIGWLDRRLNGGVGIVADDITAGIIGNLILRFFLTFVGSGT